MKSRPVYGMLTFAERHNGHLFVSCDQGAMAVKRVLDETVWSGTSLRVLHTSGPGGDDYAVLLEGRPGLTVEFYPSLDSLLPALAEATSQSPAGTYCYLSGPEAFLWKVFGVLREHGVARDHLTMELLGSKARIVSCVHCKALNEAVTTNPHCCEGCGQWLLVRDHFSRLLGAYVGVRIDAEEHGLVPEPEQVFV